MKAPKEIVLTPCDFTDIGIFDIEEETGDIKYIRADLTELTWEDIPIIEELINEVHYEYPNGLSAECFGEEVLRRFNEHKKGNYIPVYPK